MVGYAPRPLNSMDRRVWLASRSPRRRTLLEQIGLQPMVRGSSVPEVAQEGESPVDYTERLAGEKGASVRDALTEADKASGPEWVVAADTVVVCEGMILEKPSSQDDARGLLGMLSGRAHEVVTGYWVGDLSGAVDERRSVVTRVQFRGLSESEIACYVASGEPMDKAGAYGIQGIGASLVESISGCYFNVVGLPLSAVLETMKQVGALGAFPFAP